MKSLSFVFWWCGLPLQATLLWLMARGRALRVFPWFFSYTVFSVIAYLLRMAVSGHKSLQFGLYWTTDAIYAALGIAVMYEVFHTVFSGLTRITWFRFIYPVVVTITIILAILFTVNAPAAAHQHAFVHWILAAEIGVRIIQVGIFVLLVTFVLLFGLRWRQPAFGISAGFGIYSTIALLAFTKYYEIGTKFLLPWNVLSVASYNLAVLIWLWYFIGPRVPDRPRAGHPPLSARDLEQYKEVLRKVRRP